MRLLVVSARFPVPNGKGDQTRLFVLLRELAKRCSITLVTADDPSAEGRELLQPFARTLVFGSTLGRFAGVARALGSRRPLQAGWMLPRRLWAAAQELAPRHDVALVSTVRAFGGPLSIPMVVDHVDTLSLNMERRARGDEVFAKRAFARLDSHRLRHWERLAAESASAQLVTTASDARALPGAPPPVIIPVAVDDEPFREPPGHVRDLDVVFSGNMAYPPNRLAARELAHEILPRVRRRRPDTNCAIVGRDASKLRLPGVTVYSDVPAVAPYLRRARVAVLPLRAGTGSPHKALESAAAGAAVLATRSVAAAFQMDIPVADEPSEFADELVALLDDESRRRCLASAGLAVVDAHRPGAVAARVEHVLREVMAR